MTTEFLVVTTSVADKNEAKVLARALVESHLAACVQCLPIESTYRWQGTVETACEHLLMCKIRVADYDAVETLIRAKHAYEVPEIVAFPLALGSSDYLRWLAQSTAR